jgi:AsmA protein
MVGSASRAGSLRRHPAWTATIVVLMALLIALVVVLSNVHWLRDPLERTVSANLKRDFTIGSMHLRWSNGPILVLDDVVLGNPPGGSEPQMAHVKSMQITLSLLNLLRGHIVVPKVALDDADVLLEVAKDGRQNWVVGNEEKPKEDKPRSRLRLGSVSLTQGRIRYLDQRMPLDMTVKVRSFNQEEGKKIPHDGGDSRQRNARYGLGFAITGHYRGNPFSGEAQSGGVMSLVDSGVPFPLQLEIKAGATHLRMEGTVADATQLSGIDMRMELAGPTLANIYPLLLLPLPASPPYSLHGRLRRDGPRYALDELGARIGSTDLEGEGSYVMREPRPLLTVQLRSKLLDITDLGPLIGIETKTRSDKPLNQAQLSNRQQASQTDQSKRGERVLPAGHFDPRRLRVIDAEVRLQAHRVRGIGTLPLEDFDGVVKLNDAVLKLDALKLSAARGTLVARATLDARKGDSLQSEIDTEIRHLHLDQLIPSKSSLAKGSGLVNVNAALSGRGNSIADAAAKSNGRVAATIHDGRVSNLVDAASGLAIGRVLALLAAGDREIPLNCGATVFDVQAGQGQSTLFVLDTSQTQVLGRGHFDLANERFDLHVEPKPKRKGLLSLRTPVDLKGSFSHVDVSLQKEPLIARAGAVLALAAVNPVAALIPLIETGPGESTPCRSVLQAAMADPTKRSATTGDGR